jgi:hypothetical protein
MGSFGKASNDDQDALAIRAGPSCRFVVIQCLLSITYAVGVGTLMLYPSPRFRSSDGTSGLGEGIFLLTVISCVIGAIILSVLGSTLFAAPPRNRGLWLAAAFAAIIAAFFARDHLDVDAGWWAEWWEYWWPVVFGFFLIVPILGGINAVGLGFGIASGVLFSLARAGVLLSAPIDHRMLNGIIGMAHDELKGTSALTGASALFSAVMHPGVISAMVVLAIFGTTLGFFGQTVCSNRRRRSGLWFGAAFGLILGLGLVALCKAFLHQYPARVFGPIVSRLEYWCYLDMAVVGPILGIIIGWRPGIGNGLRPGFVAGVFASLAIFPLFARFHILDTDWPVIGAYLPAHTTYGFSGPACVYIMAGCIASGVLIALLLKTGQWMERKWDKPPEGHGKPSPQPSSTPWVSGSILRRPDRL